MAIMKFNVTIEQLPTHRGWKAIYVTRISDSPKHELWGKISATFCGVYGITYHFLQEPPRGRIRDPDVRDYRGRPSEVCIQVSSRENSGAIEPEDANDALVTKARELIERGLLVDPAVIRAKRATQAKQMEEESAREQRHATYERRMLKAAPLMLAALKRALPYLSFHGDLDKAEKVREAVEKSIEMAEGSSESKRTPRNSE